MTSRDLAVSRPARSGRPRGLVVVIEHEPEVGEMARRYLERARIPVRVTAEHAEALASLRSRQAAGYVIDLTMPGLDIRLVRRALASGPAASVVFLLGDRAARPRGLGSGPGERRWLVRPFSPRTLVEAVRETLAPPPPAAGTAAPPAAGTARMARSGGYNRLNGPFMRLGQEGQERLTPGERAILGALAAADGRVVSREQLLAAITAGRGKIPGPRVVDVYVSQLRAKLGTGAIRTVRGAGYALSDRVLCESWQGKPEANSRGPAPRPSPDGASIA